MLNIDRYVCEPYYLIVEIIVKNSVSSHFSYREFYFMNISYIYLKISLIVSKEIWKNYRYTTGLTN